ncbi:MAG: lipid-binding SYLF domain-containing protein [Pyrinomonadaceae bacterium]
MPVLWIIKRLIVREDPHQTDYQYRLTEETIMKNSFRQEVVGLFGIALVLCLSIPAWSIELRESKGAPQVRNAKRMNDAMRHSEEAAKVFDEIMAVPDKAIPKELLDKAEAIAVFPGVVKAAFIVGGTGGQGVISRRVAGGWSAPAFFNLGGGSFGVQIGAEKTDYVMLIMNDDGLKGCWRINLRSEARLVSRLGRSDARQALQVT